MFFQDFPYILSWWSIIFLIGTIFFPFTNRLFTNFKDRGYIFAKIIGIAVLSYLAWLLGFLHLLPFGQPSLYLILFGLVFLNLIWWQKNPAAAKIDLSARLKNNWTFIKIIIFEEVIFSATFVFWAFVKGHQSDIQGLEKFMDFGFINSILHSIYFPPPDMWLVKAASATSDNFINYYYFGHLVTAVLTKLSNLDPAVTFNLMLSTIFAFTFTGSFSIAINLIASSLSLRGRVLWSSDEAILTRHSGLSRIRFWSPRLLAGPQNDDRNQIASLPRSVHTNVVARNDNIITIIFSLLTAFLVTLAGNLHTIYAFTKGYLPADKPIPFWQLLGKGIDFSAYWYPNATRFIPFAIHEFPSYSFVVSDLHGHVLDIPFVLLTIALLLSLVLSTSKIKSTKTFDFLPELLPFDLLLLTLLGFLLAIMYMTNAWDGLIYFGLSALVFLYIYYQHYWPNLNSLILKFFNSLILLVVLFVLFSLPFQLTFKPFVFGIGISRDHSPVWMLVVLWGFFYYCVAGFIFLLLHRHSGDPELVEGDSRIDSGRASLRSLARMTNSLSYSDVFVLLMTILSTALLIFPEFFYIKDIYPQHYRANTMFKLGYQAFIMLSLASGYIIFKLFSLKPLFKKLSLIKGLILNTYYLILFVLLFLVLIYPYFSVNSYFNGLKVYKGLYGLSYLQRLYFDDYQAIFWLNQQTERPIIIEAVGESYTDYSRVSANTGLSTVLGWPVHEWLWRGGYDEAGKRVEEVKKIYTSSDLLETKNLLSKYNVKLVFVGLLEHQKYPGIKEEKFNKLGRIIFQSGNTKIYELTF